MGRFRANKSKPKPNWHEWRTIPYSFNPLAFRGSPVDDGDWANILDAEEKELYTPHLFKPNLIRVWVEQNPEHRRDMMRSLAMRGMLDILTKNSDGDII